MRACRRRRHRPGPRRRRPHRARRHGRRQRPCQARLRDRWRRFVGLVAWFRQVGVDIAGLSREASWGDAPPAGAAHARVWWADILDLARLCALMLCWLRPAGARARSARAPALKALHLVSGWLMALVFTKRQYGRGGARRSHAARRAVGLPSAVMGALLHSPTDGPKRTGSSRSRRSCAASMGPTHVCTCSRGSEPRTWARRAWRPVALRPPA